MKMRLLDVVSSSVSRMHDSTDQLIASVVNRCCSRQDISRKCIHTVAVAAEAKTYQEEAYHAALAFCRRAAKCENHDPC